MSTRWRRFEVLLPRQFNDGRDRVVIGHRDMMLAVLLRGQPKVRAFLPCDDIA
jgi:hypothetical protein